MIRILILLVVLHLYFLSQRCKEVTFDVAQSSIVLRGTGSYTVNFKRTKRTLYKLQLIKGDFFFSFELISLVSNSKI